MKNYVIINGVNSLTITGLAISKLPSISKPPLRVMTEEINGRDGDLITELGYGAYDKELVIGLYGNYDINEVIGFFNQEGTIVFSNEDDKYYNFKIINQIDYESLIKFRTATINLHCQPFKYPLTETPEEITTEYVEDEGETITLNDTINARMKLTPKGNTSQASTPTPSSPIPINVVSGDNEISIIGENLFGNISRGNYDTNGDYYPATSRWCTPKYKKGDNTQISFYGNASGQAFALVQFNASGTMIKRETGITTQTKTFETNTDTFAVFYYDTNSIDGLELQVSFGGAITSYEPYTSQNYPIYLGVENLLPSKNNDETIYGITYKVNDDKSITFNGTATSISDLYFVGTYNSYDTLPLETGTYNLNGCVDGSGNTYMLFAVQNRNGTLYYYQNYTSEGINISVQDGDTFRIFIRVMNGQTINNATIYPQLEKGSKANSYTPYGTTPIELNKIGTYQDYIYKTDKWYLHKEIEKVVLNGSESWLAMRMTNAYCYYIDSVFKPNTSSSALTGSYSNYFKEITPDVNWAIPVGGNGFSILNNTGRIRITKGENTNEVNAFKTWLSTNNVSVYSILATPTEEEITNTTLINQLEQLKGAMSYEGTTNISQVNNDLPFILKVKGIKEGSGEGIINNIGNIYAKPIIELEGTGNIGIYKNGTQYFEVDMSSDNEITIDTENMEAYHNGVLKNRKVIGDYNKFTIDEGNNNIEITGELTKATISNYTRWL